MNKLDTSAERERERERERLVTNTSNIVFLIKKIAASLLCYSVVLSEIFEIFHHETICTLMNKSRL